MSSVEHGAVVSTAQLISFIVIFFTVLFSYYYYQKKRRNNTPFPTPWHNILKKNIAIYEKLPDTLRHQLQHHIQQFVSEKSFYGCNGLEITDEIRLTIAGEACLLLLNRATNHYYLLHHILVYPNSFVRSTPQHDDAGVVSEHETHLLGESWSQGKVILSWHDVLTGAKDFTDGQNVVLHEFAHQLDQESGSANGAPLLGYHSSYQRWATVLAQEFSDLQQKQQQGFKSLIDFYGTTNPAEFFAVVTEVFYERPVQLRATHPELFAQMKSFYAVDPSHWQ